MALKEFKFKSYTIDQLKEMGTAEFVALLPSRQQRSFKRGFSDEKQKLVKKIEKKNNVKTHLRDMIILPTMIGKTVQIHTGKDFQAITFTNEMLGHYFGEYALTRKRAVHTNIGVTNKPKK
ncbi:MAG: ribosomal protein S19 family protein [Nanoarchaeota archaeon]|nr:ribosomal protein S19 family protein [Nanoarchaeota archaeon]